MKAIILAAGRGSRMKSFTNTRPKCFAKVKDKRLIDWQLEAIRESEINEIAIVTGYLREQLNILSLVEFYNKNWAKTQMVASLFCAKEWFKDSELLISYSDIFYEKKAIEPFKSKKLIKEVSIFLKK